ncbi:MAG: Ig-like domain-containing protein [Clostridia bacterium]|jgi:hypothetical protein|nr:Ig-like domain-containing protein [Clostridia bacterium]
MTRQMEEVTGGESATIVGVISDLKEKGYNIKEITGGANSITGIALSEENVIVERSTEKTITYTFIYSDETAVRYFTEVDGKDYEIIFNNGEIEVNTNATNLGEMDKEPEVTVTSSDSNIIEVNKTDEQKIVLIAKNEIGDVTVTVRETNSNVIKTFTATTRILATSLTISQTEAIIKVGKTINLTVTVEPSNTTEEIVWSSSDASIATVTQDGLITGVKEGTVTIKVTAGNQSKICTISVENLFKGISTSTTNPEGALPSGNIQILEDDASKGIVIKDKNNREWVWVVVPKTVFTTAKSSTDYTNIKANLITYAGVYRKGSASQSYNWNDVYGLYTGVNNSTTYTTMYNKMLNSVYTNGGFWIQRYEDGRSNIRRNVAQEYASQMSPDGIKTSSLLFGIQWDLVCKYLEGKDGLTTEKINSDSSSWGNYSNNSLSAKSNATKKMNIYDFAGNYWEWTLESTNLNEPVGRGGTYLVVGSARPAAFRDNSRK